MTDNDDRGRNLPFTLHRLGFALGAEIGGINPAEDLEDGVVAAIRQAWDEHHLLLLRGRPQEPQALVGFARRFGDLDRHDATPFYRLDDHPEILQITNREIGGKPSETRNTGRNWHSDYSYTGHPAAASVLHCAERPSIGGDTMFCNMVRAYETLSEKMQAIVDGLDAVYDIGLTAGIGERNPENVAELRRINPPIAHPAVRHHPRSGIKALYVSERVSHFHGMTPAESRPLIEFLCRHATAPENVYRHRWQVGDLVLWDNRTTMHVALADFDPAEPRHMLRATLLGEASGFVVEPSA
ncbi:MAG: TauD/TfdA family dioxygenase [Alphaproteobacteria bacterium]|jgi:taurine dioxygenase|nr:TauD/TfdA family dioxygenase [Alphaproteobacteria bacterium]